MDQGRKISLALKAPLLPLSLWLPLPPRGGDEGRGRTHKCVDEEQLVKMACDKRNGPRGWRNKVRPPTHWAASPALATDAARVALAFIIPTVPATWYKRRLARDDGDEVSQKGRSVANDCTSELLANSCKLYPCRTKCCRSVFRECRRNIKGTLEILHSLRVNFLKAEVREHEWHWQDVMRFHRAKNKSRECGCVGLLLMKCWGGVYVTTHHQFPPRPPSLLHHH